MRALRISRFLQIQPSTRIALAGQQHVGKALGLAKRVAALQQADQSCRTEISAAVNIAVLACHHIGYLLAVERHAQPFTHALEQLGAALFVANVARQDVGWCRAFSQVMRQAGKANWQRCMQARCHVQHHYQVNACINLGVVVGALRYAPEPVYLGQQLLQCTATLQNLKHARWFGFHQAARQFLPHTFWHQCIDLAVGNHILHQLHRLGGHAEV